MTARKPDGSQPSTKKRASSSSRSSSRRDGKTIKAAIDDFLLDRQSQNHSPQTSPFFDRPFRVMHVGAFIEALLEKIGDPEVLRVVERGLIGSVDQWSDHTHLREAAAWRSRVRTLYT